MIRILVILSLLLLLSQCIMADGFFKQHSEGWHWYHDPKKENVSSDNMEEEPNANQAMDLIKSGINQALNKAILNPTETNIKNYIELQNKVARQAGLFSSVWQKTLLDYPELNYSLKYPTNQVGKQIYLDEKRVRIEKVIHEFSKTHGFFFFFKGACPYCHRFAPILKEFSEEYHFTILAVSLDGGVLNEFSNSKTNNQVAMKLNVTEVPALFAVDPKMNRIAPIAFGLISKEELKERIYYLSKTI